jgi:chromosome segregation ATPase
METLLAWLLMFAAAAMIVLGILLLAAERELRKQRRELEKLRRNHRIRAIIGQLCPTSEAQGSETQPSAELTTRNKELIEKISSLSSELEESKKMVEELQCEQRQLVSAGELEQQLQASQETIKALEAKQQRLGGINLENQQLREEIKNLRNQLQTSESLLNTTASQYKVADRDLQLESDLAESRQQMDKLTMKNNELLEMINSLSSQLAASEQTVEELRTLQDHMPGIQSENQQLHTENQALREEIASVKTQLGTTASRCNEAITQAREITEHNSRLQTEVSELNHQLQASQKAVEELEAEQQRLGGVNLENQQLREEIATLQNQLQTSETRLSESAWQNQESAECYARLQNEVVELKRQAEEGQARVRELEATQEQLGMVESREMILSEEQDKLKAQIADLQWELDTGKEKVQELDATCERLAEMERVCQELREKNRRLEEEISRWQERPVESEETQTQVSTLRQHRVELQAQQVAVSEANSLIDGLGDKSSNPLDLSSDDSAARVHVANDEEIKPLIQTPGKRTRRFGMIAATGAIAIVATVAVGALNTGSNKPSGSKELAVAPGTVSIEQSIPIEAGSETLKRSSPASGANEFPKQIRRRVQGTYKITHSTQIYSEPSDTSRLIANIKPGIKINVVDSRNGWLEIRSKHGRPPGFVRQTEAVRIDQN